MENIVEFLGKNINFLASKCLDEWRLLEYFRLFSFRLLLLGLLLLDLMNKLELALLFTVRLQLLGWGVSSLRFLGRWFVLSRRFED